MVGQRAQAIKDAELVATASAPRVEVARQRQRLDSMLKVLAPQALAR
ncbi:hypothetical protein [Saccharopolyspora mangrovi]|uniref:Uncharacterized protein n=1 Tax=Saccharopolyspora mangrovi TaxID=3082379 RepID=A0ABU6AE36_9PSEU|nr:hypothetical protein [Saccharopolyspora sp. S2-29]MEB3369819.1 hypothetical protein [Saccharopolyspora sp. S2-29]